MLDREIKRLVMSGGPGAIAEAQKLKDKKTELLLQGQYIPGKTEEGVHFDVNNVTGQRKWAPAQQNISVTSVADPVLKGVGEGLIEQRKNAQSATTQIIPSIHEARSALDQGALTGALAEPRLMVQKVGALFGFDPAQVQNTEVLRSSIGNQVLAHAKTLGANPSNTDRDYIEKVIGGQIALDEGSIRRLLDMQEKWARISIKNFNSDADKLMRGNPKTYEQIAPLMKFEEPPAYVKKDAATAAPPASAVRKYNPATGKIE
jgi:hypothetical protein